MTPSAPFHNMTKFFSRSDDTVGFLAAANVGVAGVGKFIADSQAIAHFLLSVGQIAVAFVTVYYIWRKARAIKRGSDNTKDE